ncbi:hypothetical protein KIPB_004004, partial [Kipferlia bialata]
VAVLWSKGNMSLDAKQPFRTAYVITVANLDAFERGEPVECDPYDGSGMVTLQYDLKTKRVSDVTEIPDGQLLNLSAKYPEHSALHCDSVVSTATYRDGNMQYIHAVGYVADLESETTDEWLRVANENINITDVEFAGN